MIPVYTDSVMIANMQAYCDLLDATCEPLRVLGITIYPSEALREVDPIAFMDGFNEYMNDVGCSNDG